jgi:hypothetical protein
MNRLLLFLGLFAAQTLSAQPISWLSDCSNKSICITQGCANANVLLVVEAVTNCGSSTIHYSYKVDLFNNGGIEVQGSSDTLSGNFPAGEHKVTWRASDNCGKVINCTYLFTIKDCNPPTLICIAGLTQTLDPPNCELSFSADNFILNVSDNCTPNNLIERGLRLQGAGTGFPTESTLDFALCDNGVNFVEVWVRDANGLTNMCSNYVLVQSGGPACDCIMDVDLNLSGCARTADNKRLSSYRAITTVKSTAGVTPPFNKIKTVTTTDSCFSLQVLELPIGGDFQAVVRAEKPDAALNGVTTFDLVLISKHILGIESLTSAYQMEAADVNNSNSVTTFDIVETRKLILGINDTFQHVPSWRFVRPLPNPSSLGAYTALVDTYQLAIPNIQVDKSFNGYNFVGIKYGDLNYTAALTGEPDERTGATPLQLTAKDRWLNAGETAEISIHVTDTYTFDGWQIALSADPSALELLAVEGVEEGDYTLFDNVLRAIFYDGAGRRYAAGESILVLKVKALQSVQLSQVFGFQLTQLKPEAYLHGSGQETERHPLELRFDASAPGPVKSFSLSPNPFGEQVDFNLLLDSPAAVLLELFTLDGRRVYSRNFDLEQGQQSIRVAADLLPNDNLFLYRSWINGAVYSGKVARM